MSTLYEHQDGHASILFDMYLARYHLQTFTPQTAHTLKKWRVWAYRAGTCTLFYTRVYLADANHKPTGAVLATADTNCSTWTTNSVGAEYEIDLGAGHDVAAATEYCVVTYCNGTDTANHIHPKGQTSGNPYPNGRFFYSTNSGSTWNELANNDLYFQDYGDPIIADPVVATNAADNITESAARLHGTLTSDGGESCTVHFQYGKTDQYGTETADQTGKVTNDTFQADIADLDPLTVYHFRSVAHNSHGTAYGADQQFETLQHYEAPTVSTQPADEIEKFAATLHGYLDFDGNETCQVAFDYGKTDAYGTSTAWQDGFNTDDPFEAVIESLDPDCVYHFRAKAKNDEGTTLGEDAQFETLPLPPAPTTTTDPADDIQLTSAKLHGTLTEDEGESCDVAFDYGKTDEYGQSTSWQSGKHTNDTFEATIESLDPTTTYHFRAKAKHTWYTGYGDDQYFDTLTPPPPPREYQKVVIRHPAIKSVAVYKDGQLIESYGELSNLDEERIEDGIEIPVQPPAQVEVLTIADQSYIFNLP